VAVLSEEGTNVDGVDSTTVVSVDGSEGSEGRVVVLELHVSLEALESSLKVDLLLDDRGQGEFDVSRKVVVSSNSHGIPVEGNISKVVVLARKNHLDELLVGESSVSVAVKELDEGVGLGLRHVVDGVVSEEVADLSGGNVAGVVSVESLESRVGGEVSDVAESSSSILEVSLAVSNCNEEIL